VPIIGCVTSQPGAPLSGVVERYHSGAREYERYWAPVLRATAARLLEYLEWYAGGPSAKRALLKAEGLDPAELEALPAAGVRYLGSDTTNIYCYPSCRNARRITRQHRVPFRTVEEAQRAGYRACRACRPVAAPRRAA
jgi:hypothetical protein